MLKYKIYINESPLFLYPMELDKKVMVLRNSLMHAIYRGVPKMFLNYIDLLEKSSRHEGVVLQSPNHKKMFQDFKSLFVYVRAGGGVIRNREGKILLIFRRGHWDLPKGKVDPKEKLKATALREVQEEVGSSKIKILGKVCNTYHCFPDKGKRSLKKTKWWAMLAEDPSELKLEAREGITDAAWIDPLKFDHLNLKTYNSVHDVIELYNAKFGHITEAELSKDPKPEPVIPEVKLSDI